MSHTLPLENYPMHARLAAGLADYLRGMTARMVWTELPLGMVNSARPDVITIDRSYKLRVLVYEVKASPADLRADVASGKWHAYLTVAAGVYFAMPAGMVPLSDIPKQAGVIVWRDDKGWVLSRRPQLQPQPALSQDVWMKLVMDGIDREVDRRTRDPACRPVPNPWSEAERLRKRYGERVAAVVADVDKWERRATALAERVGHDERAAAERITALREAERERLRHELEAIQTHYAALASACGLDPACHPCELAEALRVLRARTDPRGELRLLQCALDDVRHALARAELPPALRGGR